MIRFQPDYTVEITINDWKIVSIVPSNKSTRKQKLIMKNYNKYFLYLLFGLISVTLLNGCSTKDDFTEDTSKDKETLVEIEVNTKSMSGVNFNGVTISSMRMIIADYESGIILQNLKTSDGT